MSDNPLINFSQNPRYDELLPAHVEPAITLLIEQAYSTIDSIVKGTQTPDWEMVCQPLEAASESIIRVWSQVEQMVSVNSSDEWRAAHQANLPKITQFFSDVGQNEALYKKLCEIKESGQFAGLSAARQKVIDDALRDFKLGGVLLSPEKKAEFQQHQQQISILSAKFEENVLKATEAFTLQIKEEEKLGEMPADLKAMARTKAEEKGQMGWCFTLQQPSFMAVMKHVVDRDIRQTMYKAYCTRASELDAHLSGDEHNNQPIIAKILHHRQQKAALLGFSGYSQMAMQVRMAESSDKVLSFLQHLAQKARPFAQKEMAQLQAFARAEFGIEEVCVWDTAFLSEKLRQSLFDYSDADLRPYLNQEKILQGLFSGIEKMLGVRFCPSKVAVSCADVRYYDLVDKGNGEVIGGLYLDLFARDGKRGGAWMADAVTRFYNGGRLQKPVAHVVCNFAKPLADATALLNWEEVVTLFHEFGHAMHHLLTQVDEFSVSGISGVEWDAVELPSQWLENFVWDWGVVEAMSADENGNPMPKDLFAKLLQSRYFQSGLWLTRQLEFALFDMLLHSNNDLPTALAAAREATAVLAVPDYNRFYCGFSHIFAGGYAAGYYSYLWAEVLAADIFNMFSESDCLLNPDLGQKFKQEVLAVGGGRPAMESFIAMRGREPDENILLSHYGLAV